MTLEFEYAAISQLDRYRREGSDKFNNHWDNLTELYSLKDSEKVACRHLRRAIYWAIKNIEKESFLNTDLKLDGFHDN